MKLSKEDMQAYQEHRARCVKLAIEAGAIANMDILIIGAEKISKYILTPSEIEAVVENRDGTVSYISDVNTVNGTVRAERPGDRFAPRDKGD